MASIKVANIEKQMGGAVEVKLDVRTKMGKLTVPMNFSDRGSAAENEKQAFQEFREWLQEALQALEAHENL
jgi:hypothetical protein